MTKNILDLIDVMRMGTEEGWYGAVMGIYTREIWVEDVGEDDIIHDDVGDTVECAVNILVEGLNEEVTDMVSMWKEGHNQW